MTSIKLTQGKYALIDNSDFEWLNQWKWFYHNGYAVRTKKHIRIHRVINQTPEGFETDHINRNPLDNRRSNLRTVTSSQNKWNRNKLKTNTSGINGVCWDKQINKWKARLIINKRQIHLGFYTNLQEAHLAMEMGERKYHDF